MLASIIRAEIGSVTVVIDLREANVKNSMCLPMPAWTTQDVLGNVIVGIKKWAMSVFHLSGSSDHSAINVEVRSTNYEF